MNFFARLFLNAGMLWLAAFFVDGITLSDSLVGVLFVALIFGFINAIVKPIIQLLSLPFIVITFGFALLVINAIMLLITDVLTNNLTVTGFGAAFMGAIVISLANWGVNQVFGDEKKSPVQHARSGSHDPNIIDGNFH